MTLTKTYRFKLYETRQSRGDDHVMMEGTFYHMSDSVELPPSEIRDRWNLLRLAWPTTYAALYCPESQTTKTEGKVVDELTHSEKLLQALNTVRLAQCMLNDIGVPETVEANRGTLYLAKVHRDTAVHDGALDRLVHHLEKRIFLEG